MDLFADTGICHKWWRNFHFLFQKKIHFIPDSQGVIAKELSLVRALQIHPALRYSDEIPLCYYYYICASIECVFIGIGTLILVLILVLVLVLESGIECWLWGSLSFSLYTQFLSYLVLKEVKEVCLDLSNRQATNFFFSLCTVTVKDLCFKVILFLQEGTMALGGVYGLLMAVESFPSQLEKTFSQIRLDVRENI